MFLKNKQFYFAVTLILNQIVFSAAGNSVEKYTGNTQSEKRDNKALEKMEITASAANTVSSKGAGGNTIPLVKLDYEPKNQIVFCVNRERLFEASKVATEIKVKMQALEQEIIAELRPMAEKFEEMRQEYEKKAKTLSREALAAEEEKIMQLGQELQMKQMESQETYKKEEMRLTKNFLNALSDSCKEFLLRDENAHVILFPVDNGVYVHAKYDATNKILEIMDETYEKNKKINETKKNDTKKVEPKKAIAAKR
jgi:Skp family chaperone for outer membrane proteins